MKKRTRILAVLTGLCVAISGLFGVGPALAQDDGSDSEDSWQFAAAVYIWGSDVGGTTKFGTDIDIEFGDVVDNLEMALMGAFEGRKGKWGFLTEFIYLDITADNLIDVEIPGGPGPIEGNADANLDMQTLVLHFAGTYNLMASNGSRLDLLGGVRYLDLDMGLRLDIDTPGGVVGREVSQSGDVWDAIVGVKGNFTFAKRWYIPYYADIGIGDSDFTWQAIGGISFRAASWVDVALVYRYLEWDFESGSLVDDLNFSGPTLGAIFRF